MDYTATDDGDHQLTAAYAGDPAHNGGQDIATITAAHDTTTTLDCRPPTVIFGGGSVCTTTVEDIAEANRSAPSGVIDLQSDGAGNFTNVCTLAPIDQSKARCQTIYNPTGRGDGTHRIVADFEGDAGHGASNSTTELRIDPPNGGHATATSLECDRTR